MSFVFDFVSSYQLWRTFIILDPWPKSYSLRLPKWFLPSTYFITLEGKEKNRNEKKIAKLVGNFLHDLCLDTTFFFFLFCPRKGYKVGSQFKWSTKILFLLLVACFWVGWWLQNVFRILFLLDFQIPFVYLSCLSQQESGQWSHGLE